MILGFDSFSAWVYLKKRETGQRLGHTRTRFWLGESKLSLSWLHLAEHADIQSSSWPDVSISHGNSLMITLTLTKALMSHLTCASSKRAAGHTIAILSTCQSGAISLPSDILLLKLPCVQQMISSIM